MPTTIESLELEVQSSSTSATSGIDALSASLSKLKNAVKGGVGLTAVARQFTALNNALNGISGANADNLNKLAQGLQTLSSCGNLKLSPSVSTQITNIGAATKSLSGTDFSVLSRLANSLAPLGNVGKSNLNSFISQLQRLPQAVQALNSVNMGGLSSKLAELVSALSQLSNMGKNNLTSFVTQLNKIPQLMENLKNVDMRTLYNQIQSLVRVFTPLATQMEKVSAGFAAFPSRIQRLIANNEKLTVSNNKTSASYINLWAKLRMAKAAVFGVTHVIASWLTESNAYIENMNLFTASMGEYAESASKYAEQVGEIMGIDPGEWMRNQGTFMTLIKGFGVAGEQANMMSRNLTQLAYDLASFENRPFEEAMQKVQSGIAGELEPLRRWGYDLSVARLQQEALRLGIDKSVSSMTQAEKAQLRYYAVMTQVTWAQGDMGRTLEAPANQLRILRAQLQQCARAMGNVFLPILQKVLPYLIAFAKFLREIIVMIASIFNISLPEFDYSSLSAGSSAIGDLADNADNASGGLGNAAKEAKKLKNALLGIDELNVISPEDNSSSGGAGGSGSGGSGLVGGGDLGIELPDNDKWLEGITNKADDLVKMIKDTMWEITALISGFSLAIGTILVLTGANIPLGLGLMAVGAVGLAASVMANWDGMPERLAKVLTLVTGVLGGFLLAIGAFLVFSGVNVPLGAGLMVAGAAALGTAAVINWKFLNGDLSNALSILTAIVSGALLAMGALFAFTGVDIPLGIALMAAGAVGMVTAIGLNWDSMSDPLRRTIGMLETIVGGALLAFGAILALTGVNAPLGVAMIAAGAVSVASAVALNWNSLTGNVRESVISIVAIMSGALIGVGAILALTGVNAPLGVAMIAAGAVGLAATVGLNWNSMPDSIKKVITKILIMAGAASIAIGMILAFTGVATPLGIGLILAGAAALGTAVALNWGTIQEKIEGVFTKIKSIAGSLGIMAIGLILCLTGVGIPLGVALIKQGVSEFATGETVDWDSMKKKVSEALGKVKEEFKKFKNDPIKYMKEAAANIIDGFKNGISEKYETCKEKITTWASKVGDWFKEKLGIHSPSTVFYNFATNTVDGFKNSINDNSGSSKTGISSWANNVKSWFSGIVNNSAFSEFANNTIEGFKSKIGSAYTNTKSNITTWASNVKTWFTDNGYGGINNTNWQTFANNVVEGFRNKIGSAYTNTKSNITTWASNVKSWFSGIASNSAFGGFANDVINGFKDKIGNTYTNAKNNMVSFANSVKSWFEKPDGSTLVSKFKEIGANIIQGFIDGVSSLWDKAMKKIKDFGKSIISKGKEGTDERSPSKAFKQIGAFVIEGFNIGISDMMGSSFKLMNEWTSGITAYNPQLALAVDTSALSNFNPRAIADDMYAQVQSNYNTAVAIDDSSMREVMREAMLQALNDSNMATDMRRQADKEEQTIVQVGNRTVTDAVTTQKKANGYVFAT